MAGRKKEVKFEKDNCLCNSGFGLLGTGPVGLGSVLQFQQRFRQPMGTAIFQPCGSG